MRVVRYAVLGALAVGGVLVAVEGVLIGLWRIWFNDQAPLLLRLTLPGLLLALAIVIGVVASGSWRNRRASTAPEAGLDSVPARRHAGLE